METADFTLEVTVCNEQGLHARPSSLIVKLAAGFDADISIEHVAESLSVNAKSVIEIITLAAPNGTALRLQAMGNDAKEAVRAIAALIESGFEE